MICTELSSNLRAFGTALDNIKPGMVFHGFRPANLAGSVVWAEDGQDNIFSADNTLQEFTIHGNIDYFTKKEYNETVDEINGFLLNYKDCTASYTSVDYEDESGLIHHNWEFWLS